MRMMCIRGRQNPQHTGVVAGLVYDVDMVQFCCETRALAQGSIWRKNVRLNCGKCKGIILAHAGQMVPWGPDRFAPWSDPQVSKKEVKELYQPGPRRKLPGEVKDPSLTPVIDDWLERLIDAENGGS